MTTATETDRITLFFRQGNSDKTYQASIDPEGPGFVVNFAYGRRGGTLNTGSKTSQPVGYQEAKRIYHKLVKEKLAKGYIPGKVGTPYQKTAHEGRSTGIVPQLLNPIDESELEKYVKDDRWWFQEKFDGRRLLIRKDRQQVQGINRNGLTIALPKPIAEGVAEMDDENCLIDGEVIGDVYHAFDLLESMRTDLRSMTYQLRFSQLMNVVDATSSDAIRYAPVATDQGAKQLMLDVLRREKREGVVLKQRDAAYTPGRPASGGSQLKVKFYATASCIVARINRNRRSVGLALFEGAKPINVGSVTIPPCHAVPVAGQVIEVRYLYAFEGGSLYQPVFLGVRDDVAPAQCLTNQLKLKAREDGNE
jgi:bifunctional non-homologous end joining protein LigD